MTIEEQIKQNHFESEAEKAIVNIAFTQSYLNGRMTRMFKPFKVSQQQFNVMRILKGQHPKPVSINDITDRMIDKMSNASRLVEKLRLKGLVDRKVSKVDRRQADVYLTEHGIKTLDLLNKELSGFVKELEAMPREEYVILNHSLDKMRTL